MRIPLGAFATLVALGVCGCVPTDAAQSDGNDPSATEAAETVASPQVVPPDLRAASEALPSSFALGRDASEAEIALLDIDVMPDGRGLPAGSGSVAEGAVVYETRCAPCHGFQGEGTPNVRREESFERCG